jgi:transcriptional regulator with XRE-family HTH domain
MHKTIFDESYRQLIGTLRDARIQKNMTQSDVAMRIGRTRTWIGKIESFELRLDLFWFAALCNLYGLDGGELIRSLQAELS